MEEQIQRAFQNILGKKATPDEVKKITGNQSFWGKDANSVATKLLDNPAFFKQKATTSGIKRAFLAFMGYEPTAQELKAAKKWGGTMGDIANKLKSNPTFQKANKGKLQLGFNEKNYAKEVNAKPLTSEDFRRNALKMGVSPDLIANFSEDELKVVGGIGALAMENYRNSKKMPQAITPQELDKMWDSAMEDANTNPQFVQTFGEDIEDISLSIAEMQGDREYMEQNIQKKFDRDKVSLDNEMQERGMLKGGFRNQAENLMDEENSGIIEGVDRDIEKGLNRSVSAFEEKWGTDKLIEAFPKINSILDPSKAGANSLSLQSSIGGKTIESKSSAFGKRGAMTDEKEKLAVDTYDTMLNTRQNLMN